MMAVEEESAENPSSILRIIEKRLADQNRRHKAQIDQVTQALKKDPRKNSSGQGQVGQPSKVTENGAERSGKSKNGKKSSQPVQPSTKTPSTNTPSTKTMKKATSKGKGKGKGNNRQGKGNPGGSNKDGKTKSVSRS